MQTTKCDSVFQIILSSMEFESKIAMRRVSNVVVGMLITRNKENVLRGESSSKANPMLDDFCRHTN